MLANIWASSIMTTSGSEPFASTALANEVTVECDTSSSVREAIKFMMDAASKLSLSRTRIFVFCAKPYHCLFIFSNLSNPRLDDRLSTRVRFNRPAVNPSPALFKAHLFNPPGSQAVCISVGPGIDQGPWPAAVRDSFGFRRLWIGGISPVRRWGRSQGDKKKDYRSIVPGFKKGNALSAFPRLHKTSAYRDFGRLAPVICLQLAQDVVHVIFHCMKGYL